MAESWVTLATNDTYGIGALVLAESLKRVGTTKPMHILTTKEVTKPVREQLAKYYNEMTDVDIMDSQETTNLDLLGRPDLGCTYTKLHCWTLTKYTKAVFLDSDAVVFKNCDELFLYPELSAAPDTGWPDCFNSGVFVFVPSMDTFRALMNHAKEHESFDGGDQGLLNTFFSDWKMKGASNRLSVIYNMNSHTAHTYAAGYKQFGKDVKIIHFLGGIKPWHHQYDLGAYKLHYRQESQSEPEHVEFWWQIFAESIAPLLPLEVILNTKVAIVPQSVNGTDKKADNGQDQSDGKQNERNGDQHQQNYDKELQGNNLKAVLA